MKDGTYHTKAGSILTLSKNGGIAEVDFDWVEEDACCDCRVNPYPDDDYLTWDCDSCDGGKAKLYPEKN